MRTVDGPKGGGGIEERIFLSLSKVYLSHSLPLNKQNNNKLNKLSTSPI